MWLDSGIDIGTISGIEVQGIDVKSSLGLGTRSIIQIGMMQKRKAIMVFKSSQMTVGLPYIMCDQKGQRYATSCDMRMVMCWSISDHILASVRRIRLINMVHVTRFEVCGIMEDVYLARKHNVNGGAFGFVRYGKVKDVEKLPKALNNMWFGDWKVASFGMIGNNRREGRERVVERESLWYRVLAALNGVEDGRLCVGGLDSSAWWRNISTLRLEGWFLGNVSRFLGDGRNTLFWTDVWVGEVSLRVRFIRLYELSLLKGESVPSMKALGWGIEGDAWRWRCRLFAWEEESGGRAYPFTSKCFFTGSLGG
ncbi:hypothetical protein MTR_1g035030 [Medicago truncatula]|uniref:Uncharacterized protein n=1 Tax=Medicago truncatula TaxID=3880 RepID=G7IA24_MEDTR|nr:hypothetical protein MTR_1g035030 [Medicago truncatula]